MCSMQWELEDWLSILNLSYSYSAQGHSWKVNISRHYLSLSCVPEQYDYDYDWQVQKWSILSPLYWGFMNLWRHSFSLKPTYYGLELYQVFFPNIHYALGGFHLYLSELAFINQFYSMTRLVRLSLAND